RPDTWMETATGADVLMSAQHLLDIEHPAGEDGARNRAPSAHAVGAIQSYDWFIHPFFISSGFIDRLLAGASTDVKATYTSFVDDTLPVFVNDAADRKRVGRPPGEGGAFAAIPVFVAARSTPDESPKTRAELVAAAGLTAEAADEF